MKLNFEKERIYALDSDQKMIAEVTFPISNGVATIDHTFVHSSLRGQGVAEQLMEATISHLQSSNLKAKLTCSYAVLWFSKHPEFSELIE